MGPAKRMTLASVEASLGPALGSLGVIEEADEEMGSDADEGESAPAAVPKKAPAPARAARSEPGPSIFIHSLTLLLVCTLF